MNAYIIAAGNGQRLTEAGISTPKPMVQLDGKPMIGRLIDILSRNGFDRFRVILNENSPEVATLLDQIRSDTHTDIEYIVKSTPSSMHSFYELSKTFRLEPFFMFTVDTIFHEPEFTRFVRFCTANDSFDAVMAVTPHIDDEKPLYVGYNGDSITEFRNDPASDLITSGFYFFRHDQSQRLAPLIDAGKERLRLFLAEIAKSRDKIGKFVFSKTIDMDRASDIAEAQAFIAGSHDPASDRNLNWNL